MGNAYHQLDFRRGDSTQVYDPSKIAVCVPQTAGGFGDIQTSLRLAEGLKREFPERGVGVYFLKSERDVSSALQRLYPHFDMSAPVITPNGFSVQVVKSRAELETILGHRQIAIHAPIIADNYRWTDVPLDLPHFLGNAQLNIYVEEYDASHRIGLPTGLNRNTPYIDGDGRTHLVLSAGIGDGRIGIHIDPDIAQKVSPLPRESLLEHLDIPPQLPALGVLKELPWGLAYYSNSDAFHSQYLKHLTKANARTGFTTPQLIFDLASDDLPYSGLGHLRFPHVRYSHLSRKGGHWTLRKGEEIPGIVIVHIGNQSHGRYLSLLAQSDLPPLITGDASLAEVISLGRPFFYEGPGWKGHVVYEIARFAKAYLSQADANRIRTLHGIEPDILDDVGFESVVQKYAPQMFFDPTYWRAFSRLNTSLRAQKDIARSLACILRNVEQTSPSMVGVQDTIAA